MQEKTNTLDIKSLIQDDEVLLASGPTIDSIVDGPGLRTVIWFQGCKHNCKGCHNPQTHSFDDGLIVPIDEVARFCLEQELQSGVTISGGDPFYQPEALDKLTSKLKEANTNIWVYTGFTYEEILRKYPHILQNIDVLVDGPYIESQRDLSLRFKGSANQHIVDVQKSLQNNSIVLWEN